MTQCVLVRPEAEHDLAAARDWYDEKRAGLGDEFLDAVGIAMRQLSSDPERERLYYRNFRRVLLQRFPYKIFYQIIGEHIVIFRVLHAKQEHADRLVPG